MFEILSCVDLFVGARQNHQHKGNAKNVLSTLKYLRGGREKLENEHI